MKRIATTVVVCVFVCAAVPVGAQTSASSGAQNAQMRSAIEKKRQTVTTQSRRTIRSLFQRLCPGRCELVDLTVAMKRPEVVGGVEPGFQASAGEAYAVEPKSITATILLDSALPSNFQQNIPRMIEYQLGDFDAEIEVSTESLEFPKPQNRPTPPPHQRARRKPPKKPARRPPPPVQPKKKEPEPNQKDEEPKAEEDDGQAESAWDWWAPFFRELAPWIGPILMMIVLFLLAIPLLRRLAEMTESTDEGVAAPGAGSGKAGAPDVEGLRAELTESRAVKNRVLRRWLQEDREGVADVVRLLGPGILDDLKRDDALDEELEEVSEIVARHQEPLSDEEIERVVHQTRARIQSARLRHDDRGLASDWEFLEGTSVGTLKRILRSCDTRETLHVMGKLPQTLRGSYLESLDSGERRELFLASDSGELSKQESVALASRLRKAADEYGHVGAEAEGRAALVVDMLESLELREQEQSLRELYDTRPDVARAVLSEVCLETACVQMPQGVLAEAVHRTPLETLATFLRGTREDVRERVVGSAPAQKRDDLRTELSLDVPVGKSEFLSAREEFMEVVRESARREGEDLVDVNVRALRESAGTGSAQGGRPA